MFSRHNDSANGKTTSNYKSAHDVPSIISSDLNIVGNLVSSGSVEIQGSIEGNVTCKSVTIRKDGVVKGDVISDLIQVDGEVNGLVKGKNVIISESGKITGIIVYESLAIKDGAYIDGQCKSSDKVHQGTVEAIEVETANGSKNITFEISGVSLDKEKSSKSNIVEA